MANRPPFPWLYRGTHEPIEIHRSTGRFLPGGSAHSFTPSHAKVEDTFERIRRQEFPYRPSRQTSTFWGVSHTIAEDYGGPGGFLSRVKAPKEYFLGSQELYGEATLAARTPATERKLLGIPDLEDVARQYWKGVSPQKAKALGRRESHFWEVLMPGEVTVEKQYKIYEDPKGLKYKPFQTKSTPSLVPSVSARPIPEPTLGTIPKSNKSAIPIQSSMKGGRAFFFDIETGGFNKAKSSIFSISFGTHPKDIESFYAQPTKGSFVSRWSERNVWEPIKKLGVKTETEQAILEKFLGKLKNLPEGQVVAGWNIGYVARPGGRGFDIPMLMARAEKYGLAGEYRQAFGKLAIRDIGQEYAYRVAKEVSTYEHLVTQGKLPETLFGQAKGYAELGLKYETGRPATERQAARYLAEEFKYVSGWKQEVAHAVFAKGGYQAHLSAADVASGLGLEATLEKGQLFRGEAGVVKWGRETFYKSLVSQAMKPAGMRKGVQEVPTEKYSRILAEARQMEETGGRAYRGFSKRVITGINEEVTERGGKIGDILAGKGAPESIGRIVGKAPAARAFGLRGVLRKAPGWLWKHKLGVGVSAAVVGAYTAQPLSWFSGRDDEYNTIPGLQEGGEAQRMRRILTDFGSGYQGGKEERIVEEIFGELRIALEKYGREVGTGHKRILVPKTVLTQEDIEQTLGFTPVSIAIPEAGQVASTTWRHTKHLYHIHKHEDVWTIHKDRHAASTMTAKAAAIKKGEELDVFSYLTHTLKGLPHVITEGLPGLYYYLRGQLAGVEDMAVRVAKEISSEYVTLLEKLEEKHTNVMSFSQRIFNRIGNAFSGKDDAYNTIEGLQHRGMAGPMRRTLTDFGSGYRGLGDKWADLMVGMVNRFEFYAKKYPRVFTPRNITVFGTGLGTVTAGLMWYGLYSAFSDEELPPPRFDYVQAEIDYVREHDDLPDAYTRLKWRARAGPKYLEAYQEKIRESNAAIRAQFSGKDDAWNTIEGLQHGGEAERMRRLLTDFGSGSIGAKLLQRAVNIFRKGKTGYSLQEIRGLAQSARSQSWQEFARGIGVEVTSNPFVTAQGGVNIGSKRAMKFLGKSFGKETRLMQKQALEEIGLPMGQAYIAEDPILSFSKALTGKGKEAILQVKQMVKAGMVPKETLTSPEFIGNIKSLYRTAKELKKSTHATKEALKKTIAFHEATELRNIGALVARKQSKVFGEFLAPQHMMTIPQEEIFLRQLGDRKAYALFKDVRKATDSWFSGFGDKFNTVEGLRHGGIAEDLRHLLTDFGGPWQGILRFFARRKVFTQGKRFLKQQGVRLTAPIKGRGLEFDPGHPGWESFPPTLYWSKKQAMREAMALGLTRREARAAVPVFFAHEVAEARYATKLGKGYTTFGSHVSPGVIGEELFAAARLGPESYKAIKKLRLAEIKRVRSGEERMLPSLEGIQERLARKARTGSVSDFEWQWEMAAYERRYIQGIPKIFKRFEEKHLSKFSGFDDAYNTIEGLGKGPFEHFGSPAILGRIVGFARKVFGVGKGVRGRIWGFGKRPVTKAGGLPIPAPVKGEFAISATELGKMSHEQIVARLRGPPKGIKRAKKPAVRRIEEEFAISAAELPGLSHSQIVKRLGGIYPAKKIPSGPELVKTVQQRQQNNIQRMLAEQGKPAMPGMIPAPSPAATGVKGFELGDAVIRSKVPVHEAMLAGQVTSAGRKARFYKAHTEGKIRASTNAHRSGKRHEDTTGKIVF